MSPELKQALRTSPQLLAMPEPRLGLLWSAKAGCTFAVKWFLGQAGLLRAAQFYHPWIHEFRAVFYRAEAYRRALSDPCLFDYPFIRIVRDPLDRCVSAYLAFCHAAHAGEAEREVVSAIQAWLGRRLGPCSTFSFREFVAFLETLDLDTCDIHLRRQVHPLERLGVLRSLHVVRLESSMETIPEIERDLHLPVSDLASLRASPHHSRRTLQDTPCADQHFHDTLAAPVPVAARFYDAGLRGRVRRLYQEDCDRYGY